jgi:hypothetical protein
MAQQLSGQHRAELAAHQVFDHAVDALARSIRLEDKADAHAGGLVFGRIRFMHDPLHLADQRERLGQRGYAQLEDELCAYRQGTRLMFLV